MGHGSGLDAVEREEFPTPCRESKPGRPACILVTILIISAPVIMVNTYILGL